MQNSTPDTTTGPLPTLPLEMKHHILRFCDLSTLYNTSLASLAFLQLSSPLLYEEIVITGLSKLELLFCSRTTHTRVAPLLALSHIRAFTVLATSDIGGTLTLSRDRLIESSPSITVDFLTFRPVAIKQDFKNLQNFDTEEEEELERWNVLLPFLNPTIFHIIGLTPLVPNQSTFLYPNLSNVLFPNLKELLFKNVHLFSWKTGDQIFPAFLSAATLVSVVFDVSEERDDGSSQLDWQAGLCLASVIFEGLGTTVRDVVVKVSSLEMKRAILENVKEHDDGMGGAEGHAKLDKFLRFEEVKRGSGA